MEISEIIIEIRKQNSLSQEELTEIVGVSRQAVSKWESNQSIPDIEKTIKISEHFEVITDYLLKGIKIEQHSKTKRVEKSKVNMMIIVAVLTAFYIYFLSKTKRIERLLIKESLLIDIIFCFRI